MIEDCPECSSLPKAFWKEVYTREVQLDESVVVIPLQEYIVQCSNMLCYERVSAVRGHRTSEIEKLIIAAWNKLPKEGLMQK